MYPILCETTKTASGLHKCTKRNKEVKFCVELIFVKDFTPYDNAFVIFQLLYLFSHLENKNLN